MRVLPILLLLFASACGPSGDEAPRADARQADSSEQTAPAASPDDPLKASLDSTDPEVRRIVEAAREKVDEDLANPEGWRELGMCYEANHLPALAVPAYERSTELAPEQAKGWYRMAVCLEAVGRFDEALSSYATALELEKRFPPLHWRMGLLLLELGRLEEARGAFRRAVRLHPRDPGGWTGLARVHLQLDMPALAIDNLNQVLALLPDDPYGRSLLATALRQADRYDEWSGAPPQTGAQPNWPDPLTLELARFRANTAISREDRAVQAAANEGPAAAITTVEKLLRNNPEDVSLLSKLGSLLADTGRLEESKEVLEKALGLEPDNRTLLVDLGVVHNRLGNAERARSLLERATELYPTFARGHETLSVILEDLDDLPGAVAALEEALRHDQRETEPFVRMAFLRLRLEEWQEAERNFRTVLERTPTDSRALIGSALALVGMGSEEAARDRIRRVPEAARRGKLWKRIPSHLVE